MVNTGSAQKTLQPKVSEAVKLEGEEFFQQGKVLLSDKRYKDAVKAFTKCLGVDKTNVDALFYRGVTNLDQGLPQKAIEDLSKLLEQCPDYRKTAFIVLSIAYRRINDYTQALRTLSKAIVYYPKYLEAYIARG
jgi:tetratricopeptide (TPR) repeat protein